MSVHGHSLKTRRRVAGAALVACAALAAAPALPAELFLESIGGSAAYEDVFDLRELADGTFVVAGVSDSFGTGTADGWRLHLAADGTVLDQQAVGHASLGGAEAAAIWPDGDVFFAGRNVIEFFLIHHAWVTRLDVTGAVEWSRVFSTPGDGRHFLVSADDTADGGVVAAGHTAETDSDPMFAWVVKLAGDGTLEWQVVHGSGNGEAIHAIAAAPDGGFIAAGAGGVAGNANDAWVAKLDANGALQWQQTFGGTGLEEATGVAALPGGGYVVTAVADSYSSSGRAGWVLGLDASGVLLWQRVFGDAEWGDFQDVAPTRDGGALVLGRVNEPGRPTNELWLLRLDAVTGASTWQRAFAADFGAMGSRALELEDGGILAGGVWDWGFPSEDLMLVRTDAQGRLSPCERDVAIASSVPVMTPQVGAAVEVSPEAADAPLVLQTATPAPRPLLVCEATACALLSCDAVRVTPDPACEGASQELFLDFTGGEGDVAVTWDLDGDGDDDDAAGNPVSVVLAVGATVVAATATDECGVPATCEISGVATVLSAAVPGEVSDVVGGEPPLRVDRRGARLTLERVADAVSYSAYVDVIGSWYAPTAATGSACDLTAWTDNVDGTRSLDFTVPADSWMLVTAVTPCAEGPAGTDSFGTARESVGTWSLCGF